MKNILRPSRLVGFRVLLFGVLAAVVSSQPVAGASEGSDTTTKSPKVRSFAVRHPLPFRYGERLVYDVKFSRFPISANIGELTFTVSEATGSAEHVKFEVNAVSKGALASLFGVKVNDTFTTLADRNDLFIYSSIKVLHENDVRTFEEALFDRNVPKVRYNSRNPAVPGDAGTTVEQATRPWVQDVVSAIYFARTRKLKKTGKEVRFPISDRGETYDVGIALIGKEKIEVEGRKYDALRVDARIFGGRFVRRDGELHVWFTDDESRTPVKAVMKTSNGTATFVLTSAVAGDRDITETRKRNRDGDVGE